MVPNTILAAISTVPQTILYENGSGCLINSGLITSGGGIKPSRKKLQFQTIATLLILKLDQEPISRAM